MSGKGGGSVSSNWLALKAKLSENQKKQVKKSKLTEALEMQTVAGEPRKKHQPRQGSSKTGQGDSPSSPHQTSPPTSHSPSAPPKDVLLH